MFKFAMLAWGFVCLFNQPNLALAEHLNPDPNAPRLRTRYEAPYKIEVSDEEIIQLQILVDRLEELNGDTRTEFDNPLNFQAPGLHKIFVNRQDKASKLITTPETGRQSLRTLLEGMKKKPKIPLTPLEIPTYPYFIQDAFSFRVMSSGSGDQNPNLLKLAQETQAKMEENYKQLFGNRISSVSCTPSGSDYGQGNFTIRHMTCSVILAVPKGFKIVESPLLNESGKPESITGSQSNTTNPLPDISFQQEMVKRARAEFNKAPDTLVGIAFSKMTDTSSSGYTQFMSRDIKLYKMVPAN